MDNIDVAELLYANKMQLRRIEELEENLSNSVKRIERGLDEVKAMRFVEAERTILYRVRAARSYACTRARVQVRMRMHACKCG